MGGGTPPQVVAAFTGAAISFRMTADRLLLFLLRFSLDTHEGESEVFHLR